MIRWNDSNSLPKSASQLIPELFKIAQFLGHKQPMLVNTRNFVRCGVSMDMNERQIALSVLESLREDLTYARLNNGSRVLDVGRPSPIHL